MEPTTRASAETETPIALCPCCGSGLLPLAGCWKCPQCQFSLCAACEGNEVSD